MDTEAQKRVAKIYKKYAIKPPLPTFKEFCFPQEYTVQKQQEFLGELMQAGGPKSLLVCHKIGAGKTCAAIQIIGKWIGRGKPCIAMPASLIPGFYAEMRTPCSYKQYMSVADRAKLTTLQPTSKEYRIIAKTARTQIDEDIEILSFAKLMTRQHNAYPPCLIIDEVQDVIGGGVLYNSVLSFINDAPPTMVVVLMSATPITDDVDAELPRLCALLRIPAATLDEFGQHLAKSTTVVASYYRGAPAYTFPKVLRKNLLCFFSAYQCTAYKQALARDGNRGDDYFYGQSRQKSNSALPSDATPLQLSTHLAKYSAKFDKWIRRVARAGLHFTFCEYTGVAGIRTLTKILKQAGWKNYFSHGPGFKRYVKWTGDQTPSQKDRIRAVFNSAVNDDGKHIKMILGSSAMKTGVSLSRVGYAHILETHWNISYLDQVEGRCVRYCSAKTLPRAKRVVQIYYYIGVAEKMSTPPTPEQSVDAYVLDCAKNKQARIDEFIRVVKNYAVDKKLFQ